MKKSKLILVLSFVLVLVLGFSMNVFGTESGPGSSADPVVSKSYVDAKIDELTKTNAMLQTQLSELKAQLDNIKTGGTSTDSTDSFKVLELQGGTTIIGEEGTELILRAGYAKAIGATEGGVSDLTGAKDLKTGASVSLNHLLLIPRGDGRGFKCTGLCYVMVKGGYTLQ